MKNQMKDPGFSLSLMKFECDAGIFWGEGGGMNKIKMIISNKKKHNDDCNHCYDTGFQW